MENRSYALWAGIFVVALVATAVAIGLWLSRSHTELRQYAVVSSAAVNGLSPQSPVRYQGVSVGRVVSVSLDSKHPGEVRIVIGVADDTPITHATWAELGIQGITGLSYVALYDDGSSSQPLAAEPGELAEIPLKSGLFDRLRADSGVLLDRLDTISTRLDTLLSESNIAAVSSTLHNTDQATQRLNQALQGMAPVWQRVPALIASMQSATTQFNAVAVQARGVLAQLGGPNGAVAQATQSIQAITWTAARLSTQTLPRVGRLSDTVTQTARDVGEVARQVRESPQSLLFGSPTGEPGPGEPGFKGFGSQP